MHLPILLPLVLSPVLPQAQGADPVAAEDPERPAPATQIITARRVEELLDEVPGSISVLEGPSLDAPGGGTLQDSSLRIPGFLLTEFSSRRLSFPYVRGIGSGIGEPAVVTYIDDVPQLTTGSTNLPMIGVERVEVLRGPQSALYGRNALGGVIHVIGSDPFEDPSMGAGYTVGNFGLQELRAHASGPIGDSGLAGSVYVQKQERDGYTTNDLTGNDVDSKDSLFGRASLAWRPDEDSELRFSLHAEDADDGGFVLAPLDGATGLRNNPFTIQQDFEGEVSRELVAPSLRYRHDGDSLHVTSVTAFTSFDVEETSDFDFSALDGVRRRTVEDQEFIYQEVRLGSPSDAEGLRWLLGVSAFRADSGRSAANEFRPGGAGILFPPQNVGVDTSRGEFDDQGLSLYGQLTVPLGEEFEVAAGVRFDREEKEADLNRTFESGGFVVLDESRSLDEDFEQVSPSVSLLWNATEETSYYALASRGFKAGGFNLAAPDGQGEDAFFFDPETSWTYEVGVNHELAEDVTLRAAAYLIDWEDMQLSLFDAQAGGYVANAGSSTSQGVEFELSGPLSDHWSGFATAGVIDTEFDGFTDSYGNDNEGNDLPFAPEHTLALGLEHRSPLREGLELSFRARYQVVGDFYYDPSNLGEDSFDLVDLAMGVGNEDVMVEFFIRNLLGEEYVPIAFQANPADDTFFVGENGAPRTFGFGIRVSR